MQRAHTPFTFAFVGMHSPVAIVAIAMAEPDEGSDASNSDSDASNDEDEWGSDDDGCRLLVGDWLRVIGLDAMAVRLQAQCNLCFSTAFGYWPTTLPQPP